MDNTSSRKMPEHMGFLIKHISETMEKKCNESLKKNNITISQDRVLGYLNFYKDRIVTQKELEDYMRVSHPTVVGILKRLESKGLIETNIITEGRIQKIVKLTSKEKKYRESIVSERIKIEKILGRGFTDLEIERIMEDLKKIYENIKEDERD